MATNAMRSRVKADRVGRRHKQLSEEALDLIAARFRVLAEPMRLRLLHFLDQGEMSVGELVERTGSGQANVSKHLGMLLDAGLVARHREGLNVYYRVVDATIFDLCETVCTSLGERFATQHTAVRTFKKR
jgi:DNA-binding transcriptional ArsR family regulator